MGTIIRFANKFVAEVLITHQLSFNFHIDLLKAALKWTKETRRNKFQFIQFLRFVFIHCCIHSIWHNLSWLAIYKTVTLFLKCSMFQYSVYLTRWQWAVTESVVFRAIRIRALNSPFSSARALIMYEIVRSRECEVQYWGMTLSCGVYTVLTTNF